MNSTNPPKKDVRFKTEDVTNTKGYSFQDFKLGKELQLVSYLFNSSRVFMKWDMNSLLLSKKRQSPVHLKEKILLQEPRMVQVRQPLTPFPSLKELTPHSTKFKHLS